MSLSIQLGNFLYRKAYWLYKPTYALFKKKQDAFEINLLKKYIRHGYVVLDIGANIGFYATLLSELVGEKGEVHCFEPDVKNFRHLQNSTKGYKNIHINNKAVGSKTEKIKIYTSKNLNVDHRTYKPEEYDKEFDIEAISVDEYIKGKVDFVKMDIQGFEMQAVQGMQKTLSENKEIKVISEFWPYGLRKAGSSVLAYYEFLTAHDFTVYLLKKNSLERLTVDTVKSLSELGEEYYFNVLALREHV